MVKDNWSMCPNCSFPALYSELMRYAAILVSSLESWIESGLRNFSLAPILPCFFLINK